MELYLRPAGPADAEEIAEVQRQSWRATYQGMLSPASLARSETLWNVRHWRHSLERIDDRVFSLVIEGRDCGITGFGVAGPRRGGRDPLLQSFKAEIYLLYFLPQYQGRGLGALLMQGLARVLLARGMDSALVWALAQNLKAIGFYRRMSGAMLMQCHKPFFGESVSEVALGWRDLSRLTGMSWNTSD